MKKEISKLKIALTSKCTLRCIHCRINKKAGLSVKLKHAYRGVDLLLSSQGNYKRLEIYGGEPLIEFEKLKNISEYALIKNYKKYRKKLTIHIATNATFFPANFIDWINKNHNIITAVSYNGTSYSHNISRRYPDGRPSFDTVRNNLREIIQNASPYRTVIIYCVDSKFVTNMLNDFKSIVKEGVKIIDIECVHGCGWKEKDYIKLEQNLKKINKFIEKKISEGYFIFHEKFIEMMRVKGEKIPLCPFYCDLEMYPDGCFGFYPYAFINYINEKEKIIIGDAVNGINRRYRDCYYGCKNCKTCIKDYYTIDGLSDGSYAYLIREKELTIFFKKIIKNAKNDKNFKNYIKELKKITDIFYQ